MNAFANAACSSIPVATARTFGSRITSSGAKPASPISRSYARPRISTFRSTVSACPCSSNAMTTAAAPNRGSPRLLEERLLALLQRDRVHDALALQAAQAGLEGGEARAVDHDRQARRLRLGREQVEERRHRLLGVEQVGVHVHVEQVRPAAHLLERDVDGALEVVRLDQAPEPRRAGHVRPLADDDEAGVRPDDERLEPGEARQARTLGHAARRKPLDRADDRVRVLRRRPAAAADEVHESVLGERAQVPARVLRRSSWRPSAFGRPAFG